MPINLTKFIPPKTRLEIAQKVIEEKGIRPLAREIDVNPKSVYKYKKGSSSPGDEVMSKILLIASQEGTVPLEDYLEQLKKEFLHSLEQPIKPEKAPEEKQKEKPTAPEPTEVSKEEQEQAVVQETTPTAVDQKETTEPSAETTQPTVDKKPTEKISLQEIINRTGVTDPFEQTKVEKIVQTISKEGELSFDEITELTGITEEATERYLDNLTTEKLIRQTNSNTYKLTVNIEEDD